ncbi:MAG: hypothetical protein IT285_03225 [Bdellovibrionales bacterium]|nr:hypothetical protein [Bdellovibrionales bacterium]
MSNPGSRFSLDDEDTTPEPEAQASSGGGGTPAGGGDGDDYASEERFRQDEERLIDFLKYPKEKRKLTDFLEDTYKAYEQESVERSINRVVHEHDSELQGGTPWHRPGHIGPLMFEFLNMVGVENAYVSGLQHTKSSLTKTVQQRVDEINTLLRMVGGFNRQIKASFSRSAVVYLEQEDPENVHRERVIFTVNLSDVELRYPLDETADEQMTEDGRSLRRFVWDEAVNVLAEIVSNTGMKPKYVKNDKNAGVIIMRQALLSRAKDQPDEFFDFDLRYISQENRETKANEYVAEIKKFEDEVARLTKASKAFWLSARAREEIVAKVRKCKRDRDFYIATVPDPREMDNGLVFSIKVNTMKDYTITKDRMQFIMTRYILALSRIAYDKSSDQQVNTVYQQKQGKVQSFQNMDLTLNRVPKKKGA